VQHSKYADSPKNNNEQSQNKLVKMSMFYWIVY